MRKKGRNCFLEAETYDLLYMSLPKITTIFIYTKLPIYVSLNFFFLNKQKSTFVHFFIIKFAKLAQKYNNIMTHKGIFNKCHDLEYTLTNHTPFITLSIDPL